MIPFQCRQARKEIWRYLDGTLPERHKGSVEAHLRACVACRTEYQRGKGALDALQQGIPVDHAMLKESLGSSRSRAPLWIALLGIAGITAGLLLYSNPWSQSPELEDSQSVLPAVPLTEANLPPSDKPVPYRAANHASASPIKLPSVFPDLPIPAKPPVSFSGTDSPGSRYREELVSPQKPAAEMLQLPAAQKPPMAASPAPKPIPAPKPVAAPTTPFSSPNVIEVYDENGKLLKRQEVKEESSP